MKKILILPLIILVALFNSVLLSQVSAQTENIESIESAKELAYNAGGTFVEGDAAPALTGNQIALPIVDEATGKTLGHVVSDKASLIAALNEAGYTEVAAAIAATEAGTDSGRAFGAGFLGGTVGVVAIRVAVVAGIALAVSGGGGGGGSSSSH